MPSTPSRLFAVTFPLSTVGLPATATLRSSRTTCAALGALAWRCERAAHQPPDGSRLPRAHQALPWPLRAGARLPRLGHAAQPLPPLPGRAAPAARPGAGGRRAAVRARLLPRRRSGGAARTPLGLAAPARLACALGMEGGWRRALVAAGEPLERQSAPDGGVSGGRPGRRAAPAPRRVPLCAARARARVARRAERARLGAALRTVAAGHAAGRAHLRPLA